MIIFLDLDGVLAQCHETAIEKFGCTMEPWKPMHQIVNEQTGARWRRQEFWDHFSYNFWANLPKTRLCDSLLRECFIRAEYYILTKPTNSPQCYAGKAEWCRRHGLLDRLVIARHKSMLAGPDRLLIDDSLENVEGFRGAGRAILVPRPWNIGHHSDQTVIDKLRTMTG